MTDHCSQNLFASLPTSLPKELVTVLADNQQVRVERIVSTGHTSAAGDWYDQDEAEWVVVLKGEAKLFEGDDELITMRPGDQILIPAHRKHRVEWTTPDEPTVWVSVPSARVDASGTCQVVWKHRCALAEGATDSPNRDDAGGA